jgi:hypothetical protein
MFGVVLLFVGVILIVNGLTLAGQIEAKAAATLNLLVGSLCALAAMLGPIDASTPADFLAVGSGLLFAFTYLYVAGVNWLGLSGSGLGCYCLFVAITAAAGLGSVCQRRSAHGRHLAELVQSVAVVLRRPVHQGAGEALPGALHRGGGHRHVLDSRHADAAGALVTPAVR